MSAQPPVPVVAPWQTGYTQYPVQVIAGTRVLHIGPPASQTFTWQVPTSQWWRVLSLYGPFTTSAVAANRTVSLQVVDRDATFTNVLGGIVSQSQPAAAQAASMTGNYLFMPNVTAWSSTGVTSAAFFAAGYPDVVWPQGIEFVITFNGTQVGDTNPASWYALIESYTESYNSDGPATLVPTPLLI